LARYTQRRRIAQSGVGLMGDFNTKLAIDLILKGVAPAEAFKKAGQTSGGIDLSDLDLGGIGISGNFPGIPTHSSWVPMGRSPSRDRSNLSWVPPVAKLAGVPDPACVAEQLKGNANPTRKDVEQAFLMCTK
jgi:hypothetical protein